MPNMNWSQLSSMQIGRYGEYYSKMEFASYGFDVYTSEVDDHGVDYVVKSPLGRFLEIQVKAVRSLNYVYLHKDKWNIGNDRLFLHLLLFEDGSIPKGYLIPATA